MQNIHHTQLITVSQPSRSSFHERRVIVNLDFRCIHIHGVLLANVSYGECSHQLGEAGHLPLNVDIATQHDFLAMREHHTIALGRYGRGFVLAEEGCGR